MEKYGKIQFLIKFERTITIFFGVITPFFIFYFFFPYNAINISENKIFYLSVWICMLLKFWRCENINGKRVENKKYKRYIQKSNLSCEF